jgi:anhydro-N-acetylmuramic acid kinase
MTALGLMSGTSLDGIDVALLETDGAELVRRGPARTYAYGTRQQMLLRQAIVEAKSLTSRTNLPRSLFEIERKLTDLHIDAVRAFTKDIGTSHDNIDVIGLHGQTVIHRPAARFTLQLGDGQVLARAVGTPVVYDLRAADIAAGGQGAPLVPVYHRALAASLAARPVAFVNIGGVANATWVGRDGSLVAFDTGPGNALLNDWCERHISEPLDRNGALAAKGTLNRDAFLALAQNSYFERPAPKSLDRNAFEISCLDGLSAADGAATLTHFTATSIARSVAWMTERPRLWVICGGGRLNPTLMRVLRGLLEPLGDKVIAAEEAGFDGDAMEAEAWAYLAVRSLAGLPITYPTTTGAPEPLPAGIIARP